jgi:PAS domain S-box-containing protein
MGVNFPPGFDKSRIGFPDFNSRSGHYQKDTRIFRLCVGGILEIDIEDSGEMSSGYHSHAEAVLRAFDIPDEGLPSGLTDAESILVQMAEVFFQNTPREVDEPGAEIKDPNLETRYRALLEQIPAIVFMAYLDRGIGEAYVSPQIEEKLGFTQQEWLEDPVRWYQQIHPDDKARWSIEAAETFLTGKPLNSSYRVIARDGHVVWFHCEAKIVRHSHGKPWFIHGVAFDITEWKQTQDELREERNVLSTILDTVGALVVVMDPEGQIVRFNRACEQTTGYSFAEVKGKNIWDLFIFGEDTGHYEAAFKQLRTQRLARDFESYWVTRNGIRRLISWSCTLLPANNGALPHIVATGIDLTEKKRLEKSVLEVSGREQRRIGQDLHDGLGQHLTGIAFLAKVQEQNLIAKGLPEATDATKIVKLVNEAIRKTRELSRGLHPILSESNGLMMALEQFANEVEDLYQVECRFESHGPVGIRDENLATHLFRIAQEAANNAVKHAQPTSIQIVLYILANGGRLEISDNGCGFDANEKGDAGMGLHIMSYRASMIGGSLDVQRLSGGGTRVTCTFPLRSMSNREAL